jgi:hypothetical protein
VGRDYSDGIHRHRWPRFLWQRTLTVKEWKRECESANVNNGRVGSTPTMTFFEWMMIESEWSNGEFDPGSGWTLAAYLTHASRTGIFSNKDSSGKRVSNT